MPVFPNQSSFLDHSAFRTAGSGEESELKDKQMWQPRPQQQGSQEPGPWAQEQVGGLSFSHCAPSLPQPHPIPFPLPPFCSCESQPPSCLRASQRLFPLPVAPSAGLKCCPSRTCSLTLQTGYVSTTLTTPQLPLYV